MADDKKRPRAGEKLTFHLSNPHGPRAYGTEERIEQSSTVTRSRRFHIHGYSTWWSCSRCQGTFNPNFGPLVGKMNNPCIHMLTAMSHIWEVDQVEESDLDEGES